MNYRLILSVAAAALAFPFATVAGDLAGRVTDENTGRWLAGAAVSVSPGNQRTVADSSGRFRVRDLPAGDYRVEVLQTGYDPVAITVSVPAEGMVSRDISMSSSMETIVVTGYRAALAGAIQDKRFADVIKDSITSDDVGKLPDRNAAEALQRVPGVSITIDQGEGRYVTLRGIDPGLNQVTIDGATIGAPESDRRIALDTIPSNVLSKLEVIKTVTPDMDGNAVGGAVNLVTPSAFDLAPDERISLSADYGYYDMSGESPYGASASWANVFGDDDQFGVLLSASHLVRDYESENIQGGNIWEEEGDFFVPEELVLRDYTLERKRTSFVANLEWRPSGDSRVYLRNIWNEFQDTEQRLETLYDYRNGDLVDQTPTSGTFTEGEGERASKDRREKQSILNSTLGAELFLGDWTVEGSYTYGNAEQDTPYDNEYVFVVADPLPMTYDTSSFFFDVDAGAAFDDPTASEFDEVEFARQVVEEDLSVVRLDLTRDLQFGANPGSIKFGAKFTGREKTSDQTAQVYDGFDGDFLLADAFRPGKSGFYCDERCYEFGPVIDHGGADAFFAANRDLFELSDDDSREVSAEADFTVEEDISAAYVMASADIGDLTLIGGVRVERTETDARAVDIVFEDGDLAPELPERTGSKDYTNWLPGLQARWAVSETLVLRGAWTNTIGRAQYEQLAPFRIFEVDPDGPDAFEGEVEEGNPDLEPLESMNLDASVEWYMRDGGLVALGIFYKDIDNPIYTQVTTFEDEEFEGRFFTELERSRPQNADSGEILGVELNVQQQFTALPAPFDGFGVSLNYTYTDSEASVFGRDDKVPFFLQSENIGNAAVFWQKGGLELRAAVAYRSKYLDEVGEDTDSDLYIDDRTQVDLKGSYAFDNGLKMYVEVLNVTDEPLRFLSGGRSDRLAENEIYGWNAIAGVQYRF
jgi:TonB-dependent receptor